MTPNFNYAKDCDAVTPSATSAEPVPAPPISRTSGLRSALRLTCRLGILFFLIKGLAWLALAFLAWKAAR